MKKPILTLDEITQLGFQQIGGNELLDQDGSYYNWWFYYKGDSQIHITYQYDPNDKFTVGFLEINGEILKGRELQKSDIELLIELM